MPPPPSPINRGGLLLNTYCVYKHTSPSGKVYIGITKKKPSYRWVNGLGYKSSPHFWSAIQKYGWENFKHEVLFTGLSCDEACAMEQKLIAQYKATDRLYGYNEKAGGQKGSSLNESAKKKISDATKAFYASHPETVERISRANRGRKWTEEQREKYIAAKRGKHLEISDEWRAKMIAGTRKRYAEDAQLRDKATERCRENGKKNSIAVVQMDLLENDIATFESSREAERQTGAKCSNIIYCCKGLRHTANGYKWRFANTDNGGRETA